MSKDHQNEDYCHGCNTWVVPRLERQNGRGESGETRAIMTPFCPKCNKVLFESACKIKRKGTIHHCF